jgi:hypothetical protein
MNNNADVTGGKPVAVFLQSISGVSAINPLVALYDIHGGKREVLFFNLILSKIIMTAGEKYVQRYCITLCLIHLFF